MEWHESLREVIERGIQQQGMDGEEEKDAGLSERNPLAVQQVADLLVVDNAQVHRRLQESQSTVAETHSSTSSSLNETELSILFEDVDLYGDEEGLQAELHRSFPVTHHRRRRRSKRNKQRAAAATGQDEVDDLLARWGSNSDSLLDYSSLDDMLREENSETTSAKANVFQPERRRSFEVSCLEVEDMSEMMSIGTIEDNSSDMDCKPPATAHLDNSLFTLTLTPEQRPKKGVPVRNET